jgi:hypothetical protein
MVCPDIAAVDLGMPLQIREQKMISNGLLTPNFEADFRRRSNTPSVSLIRKRCACGTTVTAKQMKRHGKCNSCVRAGQ